MANTKSAKKRIRSSARKQEQNRVFRASARTFVKKARHLVEEGKVAEAEAMTRQAASVLDKAARKGVIHPKNASRRKSRLMRALAAAQKA